MDQHILTLQTLVKYSYNKYTQSYTVDASALVTPILYRQGISSQVFSHIYGFALFLTNIQI